MVHKIEVRALVDLEVPDGVPSREVAEGALQQLMGALCAWPGWRARNVSIRDGVVSSAYAHANNTHSSS